MLKSLDIQTKLLALFAIFMPWSRLLNFNTIILILLMLVFIYDLYRKTLKIEVDDYKPLSLVFFFSLILLSLTYTENYNTGLSEIIRILSFLILPISLISKKNISLKEIRVISISFIIGNIVALLFLLVHALIIYKTDPNPLIKGFSYFTSPLSMHPSYFSIYIIFAFSLYISLFDTAKRGNIIIRILLWVALFLFLFFIKSRASIIAASLIFFVNLVKDIKIETIYIYALVVLLLIITYFNISAILDFVSKGRDLSLAIDERTNIWLNSIEVFKKNIFLGVGIGDYQTELDKQYFISGFDKGFDKGYNCHNQYLQTFVTVGLIGGAVLFSIFYFLTKRQMKLQPLIIFFFLICIGVLMLFDSMLILLHGIYFFSFFTVILLKLKINNEKA